MKTEPLNLTLSLQAREKIESCMEPELILGLIGQGYEWVICGYDQQWLDNNLEKNQLAGNPLFYKVEGLTLILQFMSDVEELKGKHIEMQNGRLLRV